MDFYANGIAVTPKFLKEHPDAVRGFIRATIKGARDTILRPQMAIAATKKFEPLINEKVEADRLRLGTNCCILTPEIKKNGYMAVHGVDSQGKPLAGAALRKVEDDALGYANSTRQMDETQARMKAHDKAAEGLKEDDAYFDATPDEQARMLNERTNAIADFYMLRTDTLMANKPDPSKLTEGVATPLKDPDTGVMEYWTLDAEGNVKQVQQQQILQNK